MQITIWDVFFKNILLLPEIRNDATNISITEQNSFSNVANNIYVLPF